MRTLFEKSWLALLIATSCLLAPSMLYAQDTDGDGMPDVWENEHGCLMANTADGAVDYDSDHLTSLEEYQFSDLLDPCAADTDADGVSDLHDNCKTSSNPGQEDVGWKTQAGASMVLDDAIDVYAWDAVFPVTATGNTVHDGNTAFVSDNNDHFNWEENPGLNLGVVGVQNWLRLWIYLPAPNSDLILQIECSGSGWDDHRWGFSADGVWDGFAWDRMGTDFNLPQNQWVPVILHLEDQLGCAPGDTVKGMGFAVNNATGARAFFDSVAMYTGYPQGNVCDLVGDFDGDGMPDGWESAYSGCGLDLLVDDSLLDGDTDNLSNLAEYNLGSNPCNPDTDGDGMPDGWESAYSGCGLDLLVDDSLLDGDTDNLSNLAEYNLGSNPCNPDTDADGTGDRYDNCILDSNSLQSDLGWRAQDGAMVVLDDDMDIYSWGSPAAETGLTVHDGGTAFVTDGNDYFSSHLVGVGAYNYIRFWMYLPLPGNDLILQVNCGGSWEHRWGFSADGTWDGFAWPAQGTDYNLPGGQWTPILLHLKYDLGCADGDSIDGIGFAINNLKLAYFDSVALYATRPLGDACDPEDDPDGDGLTNDDEIYLYFTDPGDPDTDGDGLNDGDEVYFYLTLPLDPDSDADGMDDGWEVLSGSSCGLNPMTDDSLGNPDGDAYTNLFEYLNGGDPCSISACSDGADNDGDGFADLSDPGCEDLSDDSERGLAVCDNGLDEDADGLADFPDDPDCLDPLDGAELKPFLAGSYVTPGSALGVYVSGDYAYVADRESGLQIIDVSNPASPQWVGSYDTPDYAYGVYVSGNYAYVADNYTGLQIINVSNPESPQWAGSYNHFGSARAVYVSGNYAYVASGYNGLDIMNISDPTSPQLAGWYTNFVSTYYGVYVSGNYAYLANEYPGFEIILVSNQADPQLAGNYDTPGLSAGVYVSGNHAYVADQGSGLQIFNIFNPADSQLVGNYNTPGSAQGVYVSGNYAYVADWGSGLQIINVSDPASPLMAGSNDTPGYARVVYVYGNYAYVADQTSGLQIININGTDSDGDGMPNHWELVQSCLDAWTADGVLDADNDGLTNLAEYSFFNSNPCNNDTDGDGMRDYSESRYSCLDILTPDSSLDRDGDGLTNLQEIYYGSDPCSASSSTSQDLDGDGLDDVDEINVYGTNPVLADTDGDNISDYDEIMIYLTNPWEIDTDGDGVNDYSEIWVTMTDPLDPDTDGDGIPDGEETGWTLTDNDGDGMPGSWENRYDCVSASAGDSAEDPDSDGLTNLQEYQAGSNPCSADTDADGLDDGYEANTSGTSPALPDSDGDGLSDYDEVNTHSTNPLDPDSDNDGWSDGAEVAAGADPNLDTSHPEPPQHLVNYQGRLLDSSGLAVNGTADLSFAIFGALTGGTALWTETQAGVSVEQGIYSVLLGGVSPLSPAIFSNPNLYIQVSVNGEALSPRQRITSVPMAIKAEELFGGRLEIDTRPLAVNASGQTVIHISFNRTYNSPPQVMVTFGGIEGAGSVSNITADGFNLSFQAAEGAGAGTLTYLAFGN